VAAELHFTATSVSRYSEFVQSQFSMFSQALPLHPHTCRLCRHWLL